jgi:hypothetical protein
MQNKPNLLYAQMNVNTIIAKDYEKTGSSDKGKTNPIQTQFKANQSQYKANTNPISEMSKMNENLFATKVYENITTFGLRQNKPNTNPILSAIALAKAERTQTNPTCRGVASGEAGSIQANNNTQNFFAGSNLLFFPLTWPKLVPI